MLLSGEYTFEYLILEYLWVVPKFDERFDNFDAVCGGVKISKN